MAHRALRRNSRGHVVRIGRLLVVREVARGAIRTGQVEIPVLVALIALQIGVSPGQWKSNRVVVERRRRPRRSRVALLTGLGYPQRHVVRIACLLVIGEVAPNARRRSSLVLPAEMTRRTLQRRVHAGQSESGPREVIELGTQPSVHRVALFALDRESRRRSRMARRVRLLVRRLMARIAADIESLELARRGALMTIRAIQPRVPSSQGEPVFMIRRQLKGDVPALHRMTLFAGPHFTAMNVGVAVSATGPRVREHWLGMALRAGNVLVHAPQRKAGFVVIEFRNCADRLPSHRGMAVLARDVQVAVRTTRDGLGPPLRETQRSRCAQQHTDHNRRQTHFGL